MVIVEYRDIELDYCMHCKGVWFDSGELELLLESADIENAGQFLDEIVNRPETSTTEKKRKCPVCLKKMKKISIDDDKVLVDVCRYEHGIWLDNREISQIINLVTKKTPQKPGSSHEIMSFLREVLKY